MRVGFYFSTRKLTWRGGDISIFHSISKFFEFAGKKIKPNPKNSQKAKLVILLQVLLCCNSCFTMCNKDRRFVPNKNGWIFFHNCMINGCKLSMHYKIKKWKKQFCDQRFWVMISFSKVARNYFLSHTFYHISEIYHWCVCSSFIFVGLLHNLLLNMFLKLGMFSYHITK